MFASEVGHPAIQEKILSGYRNNRLPHAFLFYGPEGCGKDALSIELARLLNCEKGDGTICRSCSHCLKIKSLQHPDVKFIFPTPAPSNVKESEIETALNEKAANPFREIDFAGKNIFIGIDTIRDIKLESRFKLYEGKTKIIIISEADQMRTEAANALLKILEEPPADLVLILTTSRIHRILPTIKSRCQLIRFRALTEAEILPIIKKHYSDNDDEKLSLIIRLANFNIRKIFNFLEEDVISIRETALEFLRKIARVHRYQELLDIVESVAGKKNHTDSQSLLWFLLLWFQDILHLKKDPDTSRLINFDLKTNLQEFLKFAPQARLQPIVWEIENSLQALNDPRNLNPILILSNLAIKINQHIKP